MWPKYVQWIYKRKTQNIINRTGDGYKQKYDDKQVMKTHIKQSGKIKTQTPKAEMHFGESLFESL